MDSGKSVGIWIRVSTEDQAKGESPEHHEKRARLYAEAKGWQVKEVYHLEATSGKTVMEHSETQRMLQDVKEGHINGLIFSKLARLARNTKELLEFSEIFRHYNADLISLQEAIDTSSPAGRLFYTVIAAMAQWEREEIAERVAASVPIRAKLGKPLGGQAPFGYQWVDKKLVPSPQEVPCRKLMYELFLQHRRIRTVARLLNQQGYRTRNGSNFSGTTIERLLRDPTAKGVHRRNYTKSLGENRKWIVKPPSEWVFTEVEPIVDIKLWDQCNQILDEQHKSALPLKRVVNIFSGVVYCKCGNKMYVPSNSPKYTCRKCRNKIGVSDLEELFQEQLKTFLFSDQEIESYFKKADNLIKEKTELLTSLEGEAKDVKGEMDRLIRLVHRGELPEEGFGRHYKPLEERLGQIEKQLPELQAEIDFLKIQYLSSDEILSEAKDLNERWPSLNETEKRNIIETITDRIIIDTNDVIIRLNYFPSPNSEIDGNNGTQPHSCVALLPIVLSCPKPSKISQNLISIGDHLKKKRLERQLTQLQLARIIGVEETSVYNWENNRSKPKVYLLPKIIEFLGYIPFEVPSKTIGDRIKSYRKEHGLSQRKLARLLGVDQTTIRDWESGKHKPIKKLLKRISEILV